MVGIFAVSPAGRPAWMQLDAEDGSADRVVTFLSLPDPEMDSESPEEAPEEQAAAQPAPEIPAPEAPPEITTGTPDGEPVPNEAKGRPVRGDRLAKAGVRTTARPAGSAASKPRKTRNCNEPHPNIRTATDGIMEIDRSLVDEYTRNLEAFMSLGYSRPYDENDIKGWYISGFSCTSPVHKAGFRRGDILLRVNGKPTRSWVGVFMLYQRLKNKDEFDIEVMRKGKPVRLHFRVV